MHDFNSEVICIIVVEVETLCNDRPVAYASLDVQDPELITPSHLLHGRRISMLPLSIVHNNELCSRYATIKKQVCFSCSGSLRKV